MEEKDENQQRTEMGVKATGFPGGMEVPKIFKEEGTSVGLRHRGDANCSSRVARLPCSGEKTEGRQNHRNRGVKPQKALKLS